MDKRELRQQIRAAKKQHTPEELREQSEAVLRKLATHPHFLAAERVMLYASLPDEVQTLSFIEEWRHRKTIILPTVVGDDIIPVQLAEDTVFARGKGYYDRFLAQHSQTPTIGLCFDFQLVPEVPCEPHDRIMGEILTVNSGLSLV